mgnify:FL=1
MIRIDNKNETRFLLKFLNKFVVIKKNKEILKNDLRDIFKFDDSTFSCNRIVDDSSIIDYLTVDKGKKAGTAFHYLVINPKKNYFEKINSLKTDNYFEL